MRVGNCEKQNRNFFLTPCLLFVCRLWRPSRAPFPWWRSRGNCVSLFDGAWVLGMKPGINEYYVLWVQKPSKRPYKFEFRRGSFCCRMSYARKLYVWNDPFATGTQASVRSKTHIERKKTVEVQKIVLQWKIWRLHMSWWISENCVLMVFMTTQYSGEVQLTWKRFLFIHLTYYFEKNDWKISENSVLNEQFF